MTRRARGESGSVFVGEDVLHVVQGLEGFVELGQIFGEVASGGDDGGGRDVGELGTSGFNFLIVQRVGNAVEGV